MMEPRARAAETAVEKLLLTKNGVRKTVTDVFELVLAVDRDARDRNGEIVKAFREHCAESNVRDLQIGDLQEWRREATRNYPEQVRSIVRQELLSSAKERAASAAEDEEMGDIRRLWRATRWAFVIAASPFIVAVGHQLSRLIWGE